MNERIKHMIEQAGTDVSGKWMSITNADKFARLIVAECASIADKAEPYKANDLIKQHFGVEK